MAISSSAISTAGISQTAVKFSQNVAKTTVNMLVAIPVNAPWSKIQHRMRACQECGELFDPPRWYSRFHSRGCYGRSYGRMYRFWKKSINRKRGRKSRAA